LKTKVFKEPSIHVFRDGARGLGNDHFGKLDLHYSLDLGNSYTGGPLIPLFWLIVILVYYYGQPEKGDQPCPRLTNGKSLQMATLILLKHIKNERIKVVLVTRALLVGGKGFLGSYLLRYLNAEVLDKDCADCIKADVRDPTTWELARNYDRVYYLAALQYPELRGPSLEAYEVNFKAPVEMALRSKFFLYVSTWHVLGECKEALTERAFYSMTKASADVALRTLMELKDVAVVRPGTLIGKGMRMGGIASMVREALEKGVVKVFSSSAMRPMWVAHVDDVARAISRISEKGVYNLFLPYPYTVYEIAELISEVTGAGVKVVDRGESVRCARVYEKRESHLQNFVKPRGIREMIEEVVEWIRGHR
jgi:nucleoside-diphosphate-sugar epimerase